MTPLVIDRTERMVIGDADVRFAYTLKTRPIFTENRPESLHVALKSQFDEGRIGDRNYRPPELDIAFDTGSNSISTIKLDWLALKPKVLQSLSKGTALEEFLNSHLNIENKNRSIGATLLFSLTGNPSIEIREWVLFQPYKDSHWARQKLVSTYAFSPKNNIFTRTFNDRDTFGVLGVSTQESMEIADFDGLLQSTLGILPTFDPFLARLKQ